MKPSRTSSPVLFVCGALLIACGSAPAAQPVTTTPSNGGGDNAPTSMPMPTPASVTASIASVTLGDNCGGGEAPDAPSDAPSLVAGRCAAGAACGGPSCQPTTLQLALTAAAGAGAATVEIASVELYDARNDTRITALTAAAGQVWSDTGSYSPWDGRVGASQSLRVSYRLHGIDWTSIQQQTGFGPFDGRFRVQVTLRVNGERRQLASEELGREPMIVT